MVEKIIGEYQVTCALIGSDGYQALLANDGIMDKVATTGVLRRIGIQCDQCGHVLGRPVADEPVQADGE